MISKEKSSGQQGDVAACLTLEREGNTHDRFTVSLNDADAVVISHVPFFLECFGTSSGMEYSSFCHSHNIQVISACALICNG